MARTLHLPATTLDCGGVCHGTMTGWFNHNFKGFALTVECGYCSETEGAQALRSLLDSDASFTAIVAGNDLIALGCYDVFAERGMTCPDDMSVVGFNEMPFLDKMNPPLTTVSVPHY